MRRKQNNMQRRLIRDSKRDLHNKLDVLWEANFFSRSTQQTLRSQIYQLFAAVVLGQDKTFTTKGISNPFAGGHHISKLPPKYYQSLKDFISFILFDQNKGNTTKLANWLSRWHDPLKSIKDEFQIRNYVNKNPLILLIREKLGLKITTKSTNKSTTDDAKSSQSNPYQELQMIPDDVPDQYDNKSFPVADEELSLVTNKLSKTKVQKPKSVKDIFIDALIADIDGNKNMAFTLYEKAAKMGYEDNKDRPTDRSDDLSLQENIKNSLYANIFLYLSENNPKKAFEYTKNAAKSGVAQAMYNLAYYYATGKGGTNLKVVEINKKKSLQSLEKAANLGHDLSQTLMGLRYIQGTHSITQNTKKGVAYLKLAASQEEPEALHGLGTYYWQRKEVEKAVKYFKLSAEQGYVKGQKDFLTACQMLSQNFIHGTAGFSQDYVKAIKYLQYGVNLKDPQSCSVLALCYRNGQGVERDLKKAIKLLELPAAVSFPRAREQLEGMKKELAITSAAFDHSTQYTIPFMNPEKKQALKELEQYLGYKINPQYQRQSDWSLTCKVTLPVEFLNNRDLLARLGLARVAIKTINTKQCELLQESIPDITIEEYTKGESCTFLTFFNNQHNLDLINIALNKHQLDNKTPSSSPNPENISAVKKKDLSLGS